MSLPERGHTRLGASRPKGNVSFLEDDGHWNHMAVPAEACRVLRRRRRNDELEVHDAGELSRAIEDATYVGAKNVVLRLVARRDYSAKELRDKLKMHGFEAAAAQRVVRECEETHLIDDSRFADVFIRSKLSAGWGMARVERELARRGVDIRTVEGWPYEYLDPEDELKRALEVARRRHVSGSKAWQKLVRHLVGRGFGTDVAIEAARLALKEEPERSW